MAAAERILRAEGIGAVTTRRVAGELGLTPMALYRHFPGKDALVNALVETGFAHWEVRLAAAVKARSPRRRLENALAAYRDFALAEPRLFELMFLVPRGGVPTPPGSLRATPSPAFAEVIAALRTSMASGELARGDPEELLLLVWAAAHGLVALHFSGRFGFDERRFRRAYDRTTGLLWERLRRG
jgi:AcrR family transcriptional regulator